MDNWRIHWLKLLLTFLLGGIIFVIDIEMQLGVAGGVPYVALILMGLKYDYRNAGLYLGGIATVLTIVGYFISPEGGEEWKVILNRAYAIFAIWVVALGVFYQNKALIKVRDYAKMLGESKDDLEEKITERTSELAMALEHQKDLNDHKTRFVSIASHEFRTPLSVILSSSSLLAKYNKTEQQAKREKHIERIILSVNNLVSILNDFLSLDRLEQGKLVVSYEDFEIPKLCAEAINEIKVIKKEDQQINYTHVGNNLVKNLDSKLLSKVITNLLSNAIKFSNEGKSIDVFTRVTDEYLTISVKDQGIGIPEIEQKDMWKQFYRASNASNIQGTGLGLNIAKRHVEMMDGTIEFNSKEGGPTEFKVQLPQSS